MREDLPSCGGFESELTKKKEERDLVFFFSSLFPRRENRTYDFISSFDKNRKFDNACTWQMDQSALEISGLLTLFLTL